MSLLLEVGGAGEGGWGPYSQPLREVKGLGYPIPFGEFSQTGGVPTCGADPSHPTQGQGRPSREEERLNEQMEI